MSLDLVSILGYILLPLVTSVGGYILQSLNKRIATLEERMQGTTTEAEVRQLIQDKVGPLALDIKDIKETVSKIFDLYLQDKRNYDKRG